MHSRTKGHYRRQAEGGNRALINHLDKLFADLNFECQQSILEPQSKSKIQRLVAYQTYQAEDVSHNDDYKTKKLTISEIISSTLKDKASMLTANQNDKLAKLLFKYESSINRQIFATALFNSSD